jgi:hypothetical protein
MRPFGNQSLAGLVTLVADLTNLGANNLLVQSPVSSFPILTSSFGPFYYLKMFVLKMFRFVNCINLKNYSDSKNCLDSKKLDLKIF